MAVKPVPEGYNTVNAYLCVDGAADAIAFYTDVLGAEERVRIGAPDGKVGHAELTLGDSLIMLSDEYPEMNVRGPKAIGGTPVTIGVYVDDVDATFAKAVAAGAREVRPIEDHFYGDRAGQFEDPWGHRWSVATNIEDVSVEEMQRRAAAMFGGG
jgi:PhnB protein